ncbi:hypothetical protein [uncultured Litoreibacter sp.]|uniref:hypothetical protein n=1 Tax=uncultured Litoreibacter sp. TaxID=1392394 RepID=UPI00262776C3|nr:hypothetical protein [uncultured Litoreibacter sp.]
MSKLGDIWKVFRNLWSLRASDGTNADILHATQQTMGDLGLGYGSAPALDDAAINALLDPDFDALYPDAARLTQGQLMLIRKARLGWNTMEVGAPQLDLAEPYTGGRTPQHLAEIVGEDATDMEKAEFLISMVSAYQQFCGQAQIAPGSYKVANIREVDVAEAAGHDDERAGWFGLNPDGSVDLTDELIALVRNLQWAWPDEDDMGDVLYKGEFAGPTVDPKRPYGDMSYYQLDIHRILGWPAEQTDEGGYVKLTDAQEARASDLHFKVMLAAQVVIEHGQMELGDAQ